MLTMRIRDLTVAEVVARAFKELRACRLLSSDMISRVAQHRAEQLRAAGEQFNGAAMDGGDVIKCVARLATLMKLVFGGVELGVGGMSSRAFFAATRGTGVLQVSPAIQELMIAAVDDLMTAHGASGVCVRDVKLFDGQVGVLVENLTPNIASMICKCYQHVVSLFGISLLGLGTTRWSHARTVASAIMMRVFGLEGVVGEEITQRKAAEITAER
jgi:hypothetical protein